VTEQTLAVSGAATVRSRSRRVSLAWTGTLPFLVFFGIAFAVPVGYVIYNAFRVTTTFQPLGKDGMPKRNPVTEQFITVTKSAWSTANVHASLHGAFHVAMINSIKLSVISAVIACVFGLFLSYAIVASDNQTLKNLSASISAVLANFGGVPLAFLFIATLDTNAGVLTGFLQNHLHFSLKDDLHFQLQALSGLVLVYLYFMIPLMVLVMTPALEGLKPQWAEAAENLGASRFQYWRLVALPVLLPTLIGTLLLLFCSAFSAYATAYAIDQSFALMPLMINDLLNGNIVSNGGGVGSAIAFDMMVFVLPLTVIYSLLQRRTSRWLA